MRLAEIIFRPIKGGEIISTQVSRDAWKRYKGYRAVVIYFLMCAAARAKALIPDEDLQIIATPLRPSWPNTFSELTQEKKFENSVWSQRAFGIQSPKAAAGSPENGLARIAKASGRAGKAARNEEEARRILGNIDASKIKLFLRTKNLDPKKITIIKVNRKN